MKHPFKWALAAGVLALVAGYAWAQGSNTSPILNDFGFALSPNDGNQSNDITTAATGDLVPCLDVSETPDAINYCDGTNLLEIIGVTSTAAELNILDGVTSTAAELNILDGVTATEAEIDMAADISVNFEDVTAANVLTAAECGKTMTLNSATEFASTFPVATAGCKFKFIIKAAPSGASYTILSDSGDDVIVVEVTELETDTSDDGPYDINADTVTFVDGVAVEGDFLDCISDGTKWYCNGSTNADGGVTTSTT